MLLRVAQRVRRRERPFQAWLTHNLELYELHKPVILTTKSVRITTIYWLQFLFGGFENARAVASIP